MTASVERLRLVALASVAAVLVWVSTYRVPPVDVPVHLATGRWIVEHGQFPTTNLFSWTHPNSPLHQQYPIFQVGIAGIVAFGGFKALSLAFAALWTSAVAMWARASAPWSSVRADALLWLVVVAGVQRHIVHRPEAVTLLAMGMVLWLHNQGERGSRWAWAALPVVQWAAVNSHQMYVLVVAVQALALADAWVRTRSTRRDTRMRDATASFVVSLAALALSPLGPRIYMAPLAMVQTVAEQGSGAAHGPQSAELEPLWSDPIATLVFVLLFIVTFLRLWRNRAAFTTLHAGLLAMGTLLALLAVRGIPFAAVVFGFVATRAQRRDVQPASIVPPVFAIVLSAVLASVTTGPVMLQGVQRGLGQSIGEWGQPTLTFLQQHPPPGRMLNLGWASANQLIYGLYPSPNVFADGRFEAYPKAFLHEVNAMMTDSDAFDAAMEEFSPDWMVAENRKPVVQQHLARLINDSGWELVHLDTVFAVAVRPGPDTQAYRDRHRVTDLSERTFGWALAHPVAHAQQQVRIARLMSALGEEDRAAHLRKEAEQRQNHPIVAAELALP